MTIMSWNTCIRYFLIVTVASTTFLSPFYNVNGEEAQCLNPHSDGTCAATEPNAPTPKSPEAYPGLSNKHELCDFWAREGECEKNPRYMHMDCSKSCLLHSLNSQNDGKCTLYMAESSIPNSGLGMYTAAPIAQGQFIPQPEIVVNILDYEHHLHLAYKLKHGFDKLPEGFAPDANEKCSFWAKEGECDVNPQYMRAQCQESCYIQEMKAKKGLVDEDEEEGDVYWLPHNYYWDSASPGTTYEGIMVESLIPGVGALANSHTGLWNTEMQPPPSIDGAGLLRTRDPGAGAISPFHNLNYMATRNITKGEEIFAEYGDEWFSDRESKFGPLPLSYDFAHADGLMKMFRDTIHNESSQMATDLLSLTHEFSQANKRLGMIIPDTMKELQKVKEVGGTAMRTVPAVIRSMEWLEENGTCIDNIIAAPSTIPQAGRGAFATRTIASGQIIAPAPLIQVHRDHLKMYTGGEGGEGIVYSGDQLILNYCFGHPDSSVMFFSYGPVVNFINHNADPNMVNAKIRWASNENIDANIMNLSVEKLLKKESAGVIIEFVATREINAGEEIFIHYGEAWKGAWDRHVRSWESDNTDNYTYDLEALNEKDEFLKSEIEQKQHPYPPNAMTLCYISPEVWHLDGQKHDFRKIPLSRIDIRESVPCEIIERKGSDSQDNYNYIVSILEPQTKEKKIVTDVPRPNIELTHRPYTRDHNLPNSFRHEIGIPDEIFPFHWLDLK